MTRISRLYSDHDPFTSADLVDVNGTLYLPTRLSETDGAFYLNTVRKTGEDEYYPQGFEPDGAAYTPPHPSMTAQDIMGANYAYSDGKHFWFSHCSPDEHVEFAADAELYARDQFNIAIHEATLKTAYATTNIARTTGQAESAALIEFAKAVGRRVHDVVIASTLGYYHREHHNDHRRELTIAAINRLLYVWQQQGVGDHAIRTKRTRVLDEANEIIKRLASSHEITWRPEMVRRQAAAGTDPVEGREYIFTLSEDGDEITAATDLPDQDWVFDAATLRAALGQRRGTQRYHDAAPLATATHPYIIRFYRAVPAGTSPGADIGSVAWTQEKAYKAYTEPASGE